MAGGDEPTGRGEPALDEPSGASVADFEKGTVEAWEEQRRKPWQVYVEAELGFRNHWYPAFFSEELGEADISPSGSGDPVREVKRVMMLGEPILFRRVDGQVHAFQDWCLHRGVAFSRRPECYTSETLTCWYHGFTYDIRTGVLKTILTDPDSSLIGKLKLRTYPVREEKGLVFVFIGDVSPPPPLSRDLPPGFLDEEFWLHPNGWTQEINCNWRPAAENGFDPAHAYLHRNAGLTTAFKVAFPFGERGLSRSRGMEVVEEGDGPYGVKLLRGGATSVWEGQIDDVTVSTRYRPGDEGVMKGVLPEVSFWLPSVLQVDPFPTPDIISFEFYVPVDEKTHRDIMAFGSRVTDEAEKARISEEIKNTWSYYIPYQFAHEDVFAREALQDFYADQEGWYRERLFAPDIVITTWRKLASKMNRGVQRRGMQ
jgi:carbazole 1,9a-dioxygenase terminal dioxygenase component